MAEQIFFNGRILTQDEKLPRASAFAVSGKRIVALGDDQTVLALQTPSTAVTDLKGRVVLPGFTDAHIHVWKVGNLLTGLLDLRQVTSVEEMLQNLVDFASKNPGLEWIQARGFNEVQFPDRRMPTRLDLDHAIPDRPVSILRTCAHQMIVNSVALQRAGIDQNTAAPPGGEIRKFSNGELKGHFTETALGLVMQAIPAYSPGEYREMILAAQDELLQYGITSATDPAVLPDLMAVYRYMERNGELKIRMNAIAVQVPDGAGYPLDLPQPFHSPFLNIDTVKFFADGGLSGKTAAMSRPYRNTQEYGILRLHRNNFIAWAREAQQSGFRLATHAIGDKAIDLVCDVYVELNRENPSSLRHRIEHVGFPQERHLEQMYNEKILAVMQPVFIRKLGANFREYLDDDLLETIYPVRKVLDSGIGLAFSTDAPVVNAISPWEGIQGALLRKDESGLEMGPSQCISLNEAIMAYTIGGAIANANEKEVGSISQGKLADFIITDRIPDEMAVESLHQVQTVATYVDGACVFAA